MSSRIAWRLRSPAACSMRLSAMRRSSFARLPSTGRSSGATLPIMCIICVISPFRPRSATRAPLQAFSHLSRRQSSPARAPATHRDRQSDPCTSPFEISRCSRSLEHRPNEKIRPRAQLAQGRMFRGTTLVGCGMSCPAYPLWPDVAQAAASLLSAMRQLCRVHLSPSVSHICHAAVQVATRE